MPSIMERSKSLRQPSPFQRGRSRVFYESDRNETCTFAIELDSNPGPGNFSRNGSHRTSPGRKSHDSGFFDENSSSGTTTPSKQGEETSLNMTRNQWRNSSRDMKMARCRGDILSKRLEEELEIPLPPIGGDEEASCVMEEKSLRESRKRRPVPTPRTSVRLKRTPTFQLGDYSESGGLRKYAREFVNSCCLTTVDSVRHWLTDLRIYVENECMNTLQNKPFIRTLANAKESRDMIDLILHRTNLITLYFCELQTRIEENANITVDDISQLTTALRSFISECSVHCSCRWSQTEDLMQTTTDYCSLLLEAVENKTEGSSLGSSLSILKISFSQLIDFILCQELRKIVDLIEDATDIENLKQSIADLSKFGIESEHHCRLIGQSGGTRALIGVCIEKRLSCVRSEAMRALSVVCCVSECVQQLELSGGVECLLDVLSDPNISLAERYEAAGVVAQITSPGIDSDIILPSLSLCLNVMIGVLTDLAKESESKDGFLLAAAALANTSFLGAKSVSCFVEHDTAKVLIQACRLNGNNQSIFTKDQVATVLVNMSAFKECRDCILQAGGIVALLCFLQVRPSPLQSPAETNASERVLHKSAVALSRLCEEESVAKQIISMQGDRRLIRLCQDEKERNDSDTVLSACLTLFQKLAAAYRLREFTVSKEQLMKKGVLDSLVVFFSQEESFV